MPMPPPKIISPLILVVIYISIANSESISSKPALFLSPQLPASPSYPKQPGSPASPPTYPNSPAPSPSFYEGLPNSNLVPSPSFYPGLFNSNLVPSPSFDPELPDSNPVPSPSFDPELPDSNPVPSPSFYAGLPDSKAPVSPSYSAPSSSSYPGLPDPEVPVSPSYPAVPPPSSSSPAIPVSPSYPAIPTPAPSSDPWVPNPGVPAALPSYPATPPPSPSSYPVPISPEPASPAPYPLNPDHGSEAIKAAYWPSFDGFEASSIDTSYFTHIYYAFLLIEPYTFKLNVTPFDQLKLPEFMDAIHARQPRVKTLLSIGGAGNDPKIFAQMASTIQTRAIFINSTIEIARSYGFDGVDLDWEFPANDQEMFDLALLYQQWRKALEQESRITKKPRLLLTSAVYYSSKVTYYPEAPSYPGEAMNRYLDWINPMCYDYNGPWSNFTGPNSALYDPSTNISTSFGIRAWLEAGVSAKKIVMGLPLYGHTWTLQDPSVNGFGAPAVGEGPGDGTLTYSEIVEFNEGNKAVVNFAGGVVSYYSYAGDVWIGYDDTVSVDWKIRFAKSWGLGGYFFWALGQDDSNWTISRLASTVWGN